MRKRDGGRRGRALRRGQNEERGVVPQSGLVRVEGNYLNNGLELAGRQRR